MKIDINSSLQFVQNQIKTIFQSSWNGRMVQVVKGSALILGAGAVLATVIFVGYKALLYYQSFNRPPNSKSGKEAEELKTQKPESNNSQSEVQEHKPSEGNSQESKIIPQPHIAPYMTKENFLEFGRYTITKEKRILITLEEAGNFISEFNKKDKERLAGCQPKPQDRYQDILQPDSTMVGVEDDLERKIHFNGALFEHKAGTFIIMQGPTALTVPDVQQMVNQHNVKLIVTLTKDVEKRVNKCYPFWEGWLVTRCLGSTRSFTQRDASAEWNNLCQLHFEEWPDQGVPKNAACFLEFLQCVENEKKKLQPDEAIAVHCSAGIGRSGVFMVIHLVLYYLNHGVGEINPLALIQELRRYRPGMVQTSAQLKFVFDVINHFFRSRES